MFVLGRIKINLEPESRPAFSQANPFESLRIPWNVIKTFPNKKKMFCQKPTIHFNTAMKHYYNKLISTASTLKLSHNFKKMHLKTCIIITFKPTNPFFSQPTAEERHRGGLRRAGADGRPLGAPKGHGPLPRWVRAALRLGWGLRRSETLCNWEVEKSKREWVFVFGCFLGGSFFGPFLLVLGCFSVGSLWVFGWCS